MNGPSSSPRPAFLRPNRSPGATQPTPGDETGLRAFDRLVGEGCYLPAARRCQRVRFSIFLCFFLRIRLRRFLISDPMAGGTLAQLGQVLPIEGWWPGARSLQSVVESGACAPIRQAVGRDCCKNAGRRIPSGVVQSAERRPLEPDVGGSSPPPGARLRTRSYGFTRGALVCHEREGEGDVED